MQGPRAGRGGLANGSRLSRDDGESDDGDAIVETSHADELAQQQPHHRENRHRDDEREDALGVCAVVERRGDELHQRSTAVAEAGRPGMGERVTLGEQEVTRARRGRADRSSCRRGGAGRSSAPTPIRARTMRGDDGCVEGVDRSFHPAHPESGALCRLGRFGPGTDDRIHRGSLSVFENWPSFGVSQSLRPWSRVGPFRDSRAGWTTYCGCRPPERGSGVGSVWRRWCSSWFRPESGGPRRRSRRRSSPSVVRHPGRRRVRHRLGRSVVLHRPDVSAPATRASWTRVMGLGHDRSSAVVRGPRSRVA